MTLAVYTYSPEEVDFIVSGYKITGWNSIAISRMNAGFTHVAGVRGKNTRIRNRNSGATIFVDVVRTSPVNTVFSEIHRKDLIYGTGRLEIMIKDKQGGSLYSSIEAYIDKYPDDAFTTEMNNRRWTINCQSTNDWNVAGSEKAQESLYSRLTSGVADAIDGFLN